MKRTMLQIYVRGSARAVDFYRNAFGASIGNDWRNPDGSCAHTELTLDGQLLAISEAPENTVCGTGMQFCLQYEPCETEKVLRAYAELQENAEILSPLGECPFSRCMFSLIDKYGVFWCIWN